jgi:F-type H+-transporting ATPase subunit gamma
LTEEVFLPVQLDNTPVQSEEQSVSTIRNNYIVEPSVESLLQNLIPKSLHLKVYTALLDSLASEHAARIVAMQVATDNADELLRQLTLTYNKTRQQAITTELLDIVGGSMQ